ncbi:MAG TPA: 4-(cytidine 5'-diphospho)-2-C-methyl-D-erythritol kinase [Pyrinomonadaceae bacterium]|nr:4-(cytidine 5'-diphospho)-2-C-methyl-D-erythritol kinase [Pyrinomonadaceae bacterium]
MSTNTFTVPSFAKINWNLRVLGKRVDGYHEIRTLLQTVSLHDNLSFTLREDPDIVLSCNDPYVPTDTNNLIIRAARALRDNFGVKSGAKIALEKHIPVQAGLGGGSSNAAVTLLALAHLWELPASITELREIAASLGADVPFFFYGGCSLGTGVGTTLSPLPDHPTVPLLIVTPRAKVSTSEAYGALHLSALTSPASDSILAVSRGSGNSKDFDQWSVPGEQANDFEQVIFDIEPEIARVKVALLQTGARAALLAGSGSSVFGIFDNREAQQRAVQEIRVESGWRVFSCDTISREEYFRALGVCGTTLLRSS